MIKNPLILFTRYFERLRSPQLVVFLGLLFLIDLFTPDPVPFVDEGILFLLTMLAARWKRPEAEPASKPPPKNVTPPDRR